PDAARCGAISLVANAPLLRDRRGDSPRRLDASLDPDLPGERVPLEDGEGSERSRTDGHLERTLPLRAPSALRERAPLFPRYALGPRIVVRLGVRSDHHRWIGETDSSRRGRVARRVAGLCSLYGDREISLHPVRLVSSQTKIHET